MSTPAEQLLGSGPVLPLAAPRVSLTTRWSIGAIGLILLVALSVFGSRLAQDPDRFPVTNVDILGTVDYEDRDALIAVVQEFTGAGFYSLDIDSVRRAVDELPWVAHARVSRVWPSRIEVRVDGTVHATSVAVGQPSICPMERGIQHAAADLGSTGSSWRIAGHFQRLRGAIGTRWPNYRRAQ